MTIFSEFGVRESPAPVLKARRFAFEQLVYIHDTTLDMRWALVQLAWRSFTAMCALVQGQFVSSMRKANAPRPEGRGEHCCC